MSSIFVGKEYYNVTAGPRYGERLVFRGPPGSQYTDPLERGVLYDEEWSGDQIVFFQHWRPSGDCRIRTGVTYDVLRDHEFEEITLAAPPHQEDNF